MLMWLTTLLPDWSDFAVKKHLYSQMAGEKKKKKPCSSSFKVLQRCLLKYTEPYY